MFLTMLTSIPCRIAVIGVERAATRKRVSTMSTCVLGQAKREHVVLVLVLSGAQPAWRAF